MIHLSRLERLVLIKRTHGMTTKTLADQFRMTPKEINNVFNGIARRTKTVTDTIHIQKVISEAKQPLMIDYTNFIFKGKPLQQLDIWRIMCKYSNKNPQDKKFLEVINVAQTILENDSPKTERSEHG